MNEALPSVTVLIAARPDQADIKAVTAARALDYPREKLEIIVARGKQPSVQRNAAIRAAKGRLIYFLDDDSMPSPGNLHRAVGHFADAKVKMAGGPSLCPPDAPLLEQVFALVHASWLAFWSSRARYAAVGTVRESGEKELILCNLMARRDALLESGGFDEALYPNEENALMDHLQKNGGRLLYDPQLVAYRRPRHNLNAFVKMLLNYGRGRAEQFRLHPTTGSAVNFVPPAFCLYLAALPMLVYWFGPIWLVFLACYAAILLVQAAALIPRGGFWQSLGAVPLIVLTHVLYGLGFWWGMFTTLNSNGGADGAAPKTPVVLETVPL